MDLSRRLVDLDSYMEKKENIKANNVCFMCEQERTFDNEGTEEKCKCL